MPLTKCEYWLFCSKPMSVTKIEASMTEVCGCCRSTMVQLYHRAIDTEAVRIPHWQNTAQTNTIVRCFPSRYLHDEHWVVAMTSTSCPCPFPLNCFYLLMHRNRPLLSISTYQTPCPALHLSTESIAFFRFIRFRRDIFGLILSLKASIFL